MRLLCAGDLHLGRRSSRLPSIVNPHETAAAAAWSAIVDVAISERVDVVALSGDLVDRDNRYYEAIGPLEKGLRRLHEAEIITVTVAGNHDFSVLPDLARTLPSGCLKVLGAGAQWERVTVSSRAGDRLHIDGWSFDRAHVSENPLLSYNPVSPDAPILGLLHADLDQPASPYAPVSLAELQGRPIAMWLLGHVHAPALRSSDGKPPVLYPGSPQPLDPGERGAHGAWLVEITEGVTPLPQLVPLATVRYEVVEVDVTGVSDLATARVLIVNRIRALAEQCATECEALRHLSVRVRLAGKTSAYRLIAVDAENAPDFDLAVGHLAVYVENVTCEVRPDRDINALAAGSDAVAWIARLLLACERNEESVEHADLLGRLNDSLRAVKAAKPFRSLDMKPNEEDREALRGHLVATATTLLDELCDQAEAVR